MRTEGTQTSQTCAAEVGMKGAGRAAKNARMVAATSCGPASAGTGCPRSSASRTCLHRSSHDCLGHILPGARCVVLPNSTCLRFHCVLLPLRFSRGWSNGELLCSHMMAAGGVQQRPHLTILLLPEGVPAALQSVWSELFTKRPGVSSRLSWSRYLVSSLRIKRKQVGTSWHLQQTKCCDDRCRRAGCNMHACVPELWRHQPCQGRPGGILDRACDTSRGRLLILHGALSHLQCSTEPR